MASWHKATAIQEIGVPRVLLDWSSVLRLGLAVTIRFRTFWTHLR